MNRRYRKAFWPAVLLILVAGYVSRGRPGTSATPAQGRPTPRAAPRPETESRRPSTRPSQPLAESEPPAVPHARHEDDRRLHLRVVGVHDGDTLTGLDDTKTQHKIRLDAIDAPELGQPFGQAAKQALSEKVFGKDVVVTVKTRDKYGRTVGHVLIDGRDVNLEMLEEGMAWHYVKYDHNSRLQEAERAARAAGAGLWRDPDPVAPWEWRASRQRPRG